MVSSDTTFQFPELKFTPSTLDPEKIARTWFADFAASVSAGNIQSLLSLFHEEAYWKDILALTWNYRTIHGSEDIHRFLTARLALSNFSSLRLSSSNPPTLSVPYSDIGWVQGFFEFRTTAGTGTGIFRLVCIEGSLWKAYTIFTSLESLESCQEAVGPGRNFQSDHGLWMNDRRQEMEFDGCDPTVLILGAGQSGLSLAARLKVLGVSALVIEKNEHVGDNWRDRYQTVSLNDPVWRNHLPYLPFPDTWPVYMNGPKIADWLQAYATLLDLNVWTSSIVEKSPLWNSQAKHWTVSIKRKGTCDRILRPKHVVWAVGLKQGPPNIPDFRGVEQFTGMLLHSTAYQSGQYASGKKVLVIGASMSGHDIARDCYTSGADVTMYQRGSTYIMSFKGVPLKYKPLYWMGGPPTDVADSISQSMPHAIGKFLAIRKTEALAEMDKPLLDGLRSVGFKLDMGLDNAGTMMNALSRGGGHYEDKGACQLIIDGKVKLKNGCEIDHFTKDGVQFSDGSEVKADVVILGTGYRNGRFNLHDVFPEDFIAGLKNADALDEEGEWEALWRDSGHEGFWFATGNFPTCRYFSKRLALQIKAIEMGCFGPRYTE